MNKRGDLGWVTKAILVLILLGVSVVVYGKVTTGSTKVLQCVKNGGECVEGTCNLMSQVPALSDKAAGCKEGQLCCINITQSTPVDPGCKDKKEGDICNSTSKSQLYICGPSLQCMTKCEYCSLNYGTTAGKDICQAAYNTFARNSIVNPNKRYTCACSAAECTPEMIASGQCISDYCPQGDGKKSDYMCCVK